MKKSLVTEEDINYDGSPAKEVFSWGLARLFKIKQFFFRCLTLSEVRWVSVKLLWVGFKGLNGLKVLYDLNLDLMRSNRPRILIQRRKNV